MTFEIQTLHRRFLINKHSILFKLSEKVYFKNEFAVG